MLIKCKNANDAVGITKGKLYTGYNSDGKYVLLTNDNGKEGYYKLRRFTVLIDE